MSPGDEISSFAEVISYQETIENVPITYDNDPVWLMKNLSTVFGGGTAQFQDLSRSDQTPIPTVDVTLPTDIIGAAVNISPPSSDWSVSQMSNPEDMPGVFSKIDGSDLDNIVGRLLQEENYISHTIINPLVQEAYISLQLDELGYMYEGDEVKVEYQIGKLWTWLLGALSL